MGVRGWGICYLAKLSVSGLTPARYKHDENQVSSCLQFSLCVDLTLTKGTPHGFPLQIHPTEIYALGCRILTISLSPDLDSG